MFVIAENMATRVVRDKNDTNKIYIYLVHVS